MGLLNRLIRKNSLKYATPPHLRLTPDQLIWLPGLTEVQVAGETYHLDAIRAAQAGTQPDGTLIAVLVPEPGNRHDSNSVAVYVQGGHVGFLLSDVAARVAAAIRTFTAVQPGRFVSCPARIHTHPVGPQIVLMLDTAPVGLPSEAFETVPDLAATLIRLLPRLHQPAPALTGANAEARHKLNTWRSSETNLRSIIDRLARAKDPMVGEACLILAKTIRYQAGRRDDTLAAYVEALYYDRTNTDIWRELAEYTASAPHIPTLVDLFAKSPATVRPELLPLLVSISDGHDRVGKLDPAKGPVLRAALLELAEDQADQVSMAYLAADAGHRAEKTGDLPAAAMAWRAAVAAGSTDAKVADRFSTWLVKHGKYVEAAHVLRQALTTPPTAATLRERLEKRLARCEKALC
ncbi:MAG: hypothetical protein JWQ95_1897 [Sphaerisporangium sp.]|nr:hypothetical protein [Sphaerisporangium sp.]